MCCATYPRRSWRASRACTMRHIPTATASAAPCTRTAPCCLSSKRRRTACPTECLDISMVLDAEREGSYPLALAKLCAIPLPSLWLPTRRDHLRRSTASGTNARRLEEPCVRLLYFALEYLDEMMRASGRSVHAETSLPSSLPPSLRACMYLFTTTTPPSHDTQCAALHSLKKSLPLSSTTTKAGKSFTSIFQMASIPSSAYSRTSTLVMLFCARMAAGPPMEPR